MSAREKNLLEKGKAYYQRGRYTKAVQAFTNALLKVPSGRFAASCYTNRAAALLKLKDYSKARDDCHEALKLNENHVSAHHYLGQALCELNQLDEGITELQTALNLCRRSINDVRENEYAKVLRDWRKKRFEKQETEQISAETELLSYLESLILENQKRETSLLRERGDAKGTVRSVKTSVEDEIAKIQLDSEKRLEQIRNLFKKKNRTIPEFFLSNISYELLRDPVVAPSGITYERQDILKHFSRVNQTDPMTGEPLIAEDLVPNLALKEAIENFVKENEWALHI